MPVWQATIEFSNTSQTKERRHFRSKRDALLFMANELDREVGLTGFLSRFENSKADEGPLVLVLHNANTTGLTISKRPEFCWDQDAKPLTFEEHDDDV